MTVRPDVDVIANAVKDNRLTSLEGMEWIKLPIFILPKKHTLAWREFMNFYDKKAECRRKLTESKPDVMNETIRDYFRQEGRLFIEFVVESTIPGDFVRYRIDDDETIEIMAAAVPDTGVVSPKGFPLPRFKIGFKNGPGGSSDLVLDYEALEPFKSRYTKKVPDVKIRARYEREAMEESFKTYLEWVTFCEYNEEQDRYAVSRTVEKRVKAAGITSFKKQLNLRQGPSIIFLDDLPKVRGTDESEPTGKTVRPHQRRGTWVTLRSERYRYHPKYLVENGLYRRPAWVGPKEAIVEGNIYTVLE